VWRVQISGFGFISAKRNRNLEPFIQNAREGKGKEEAGTEDWRIVHGEVRLI